MTLVRKCITIILHDGWRNEWQESSCDFFLSADLSSLVVKPSIEPHKTEAALKAEARDANISQVTCRNASFHIREPSFSLIPEKQVGVKL